MAWIAHVYTALGAAAALLATLNVFAAHFRDAFIWLAVQVFIDSTDGFLARRLRVKERLPNIDGDTLDNVIDYLCYVFIPVLLITRANLLPEGGAEFYLGSVIMMASAYGFSRTDAKIQAGGEYFFTGFPSYWNIVALYMYVFRLEQQVNAAILLVFAALVFVPLRYVYPSRTKAFRALTMILGCSWAVVVCWMVWRLPATDGPWPWLALVFPAYYFVLSFWLDWKSRR